MQYYSKQFLSNFEYGLDVNCIKDLNWSMPQLDSNDLNKKDKVQLPNENGLNRFLSNSDSSKSIDQSSRTGSLEDQYFSIKLVQNILV